MREAPAAAGHAAVAVTAAIAVAVTVCCCCFCTCVRVPPPLDVGRVSARATSISISIMRGRPGTSERWRGERCERPIDCAPGPCCSRVDVETASKGRRRRPCLKVCVRPAGTAQAIAPHAHTPPSCCLIVEATHKSHLRSPPLFDADPAQGGLRLGLGRVLDVPVEQGAAELRPVGGRVEGALGGRQETVHPAVLQG